MKKIVAIIKTLIGRLREGGVKITNNGKNNKIQINSRLKGIGTLKIIISGNNNNVIIGERCILCRTNIIFMQGNNNTVVIGNHVTFDQDVSIVCCEGTTVRIGEDCMLAKAVRIRTSDQHPIYNDDCERINYPKNVIIGEHVWVGATCLIMKGVEIGKGSIIGINSMVTKNIPENVVAVGSPCQVIKSNVHWERKLKE